MYVAPIIITGEFSSSAVHCLDGKKKQNMMSWRLALSKLG